MLGAGVAAGTPVGLKAKDLMARGALVPDDVVVAIVAERIDKPDAAPRLIFLGFSPPLARAGAARADARKEGAAARCCGRAQGRSGHPAAANREPGRAGAAEGRSPAG